MPKREITQAEMRRELKAMGYNVRTRQGSDFSTATVTLHGDKINGGNVITPEFLAEHREFFDWKNSVSVVDEGWRTIL